jgi:hypothetical protein
MPKLSSGGEELRPGGPVIVRVVDLPNQGLARRGDFVGTCVPYFDIYVYQ